MIRIQVSIPIQIAIPLAFWCYLRGEQMPSWIKNVIALRIKANIDNIKKELCDSAELQNTDVETLKKQILEMYDIHIEEDQ